MSGVGRLEVSPTEPWIGAGGMLGSRWPQADRQITEKDRCQACKGAGWTWWSPEAEPEGKCIVCREFIGTGRTDQKGRKRQNPDESPNS